VDRYSRQARVAGVGADGVEKIRRATVLVVGCGALGTHLDHAACAHRHGLGLAIRSVQGEDVSIVQDDICRLTAESTTGIQDGHHGKRCHGPAGKKALHEANVAIAAGSGAVLGSLHAGPAETDRLPFL